MYTKQVVRHRTWNNMSDDMDKARNMLGIKKVDRIYDRNSNQLALIVSTKETLDQDVNASLQGDMLVLEAPIHFEEFGKSMSSYGNSHADHGNEGDITLAGISEIKLKPGYRYSLVSCQLANPKLVKIILSSNYIINNNHRK